MYGRITSISQDFMQGGISVGLNVKNVSMQELQALAAHEKLVVEMKKYREPRSKDANAYFHVLVGKIADVLGTSKTRTKNILIGRYGQIDFLDGQPIHIETEIPVEKMLEQESVHCVLSSVKVEMGKGIYSYIVYRGSHTYDSKEMSILIDGTVQEAKELGIETMPPDELERMVQAWRV